MGMYRAGHRIGTTATSSVDERLTVVVESYRRLPCYTHRMYRRYDDFERADVRPHPAAGGDVLARCKERSSTSAAPRPREIT
jgi:hypothetical protein